MKYRNNFVYVQRQIDRVFRIFRTFVRIYVNDIVMFNHSLKKHFRHLHQMFVLFDKLNIVFKSSKIYFDYFIISLLRQKINRFEFSTTQKKFVIILRFKFFKTLKNFEIYLNIIDYLRNYVAFYVQKIDVLRQRKIMLLKNFSFNKERVRKNFNRRIFVHDSSIDEIDFYKQLQNFFDRFNWLIHHNSIRIFYVDVNDFRRDFEIMIYHLKSDKNHVSQKKLSTSNDDRKTFFF